MDIRISGFGPETSCIHIENVRRVRIEVPIVENKPTVAFEPIPNSITEPQLLEYILENIWFKYDREYMVFSIETIVVVTINSMKSTIKPENTNIVYAPKAILMSVHDIPVQLDHDFQEFLRQHIESGSEFYRNPSSHVVYRKPHGVAVVIP